MARIPQLAPSQVMVPMFGDGKPRHFVYVIYEDGAEDKFCKIGTAEWVPYRIMALQCGNPRKLKVAAAWNIGRIKESHRIERAVKKRFGRVHKDGDWLPCSADTVIAAVNSALEAA